MALKSGNMRATEERERERARALGYDLHEVALADQEEREVDRPLDRDARVGAEARKDFLGTLEAHHRRGAPRGLPPSLGGTGSGDFFSHYLTHGCVTVMKSCSLPHACHIARQWPVRHMCTLTEPCDRRTRS